MGPAFVIVIWAILALVGGAIWLALAAGVVAGFVLKKRWLKWTSGVLLTVLSAAAILVFGLFVYGTIQAMRPAVVFAQAFGQKPPAGVSNIQSKYWFFADSGTIYLKFKCPAAVFKGLVPAGLSQVPRNEIQWLRLEDGAPHWWSAALKDATVEVFSRESPYGAGKRFASESELWAYDQTTQTAYYRFIGID